ncbi:MAG: lysylphosphatidylglycerol synthetase family protein, partial [Caldilineaceae bacterium]|nr:lysylphosphatidylglycerol synthetase family protein [Caldilineaceae bacterium]
MRKWLLWLLTLAFGWVLVTHLNELEQLGATVIGAQWQWLLAAVGLQLLFFIAYTGVYQAAFTTVGVRSNLWHLLPATFASLFVNMAAPTGGAAGAALFIDEVARRGESRTRATVGVLLMLVLDFGVLALIVLADLGVLWAFHDLYSYQVIAAVILVLFVGAMAAALTLGLWHPGWLRATLDFLQIAVNRVGRWVRRPQLLDETWGARNTAEFTLAAQAMLERPLALLWTLMIATAAHGINLLSLYALFFAFRQPATFGIVLTGYAMTILFFIVSPTPNGVGIVEGLLPVIYTSLGLPLATATVISLTYRALTFWVPMLGGFFLLRRLSLFSPHERSLAEQEQPHIVAVATALMGGINILSGVLPGFMDRVRLLATYSPLEVRHGGRMTAVLAGFALILLARGLWRRKETAWWLALVLLVLSAGAHLLKGLDYEEAILAAALAITLWTQRSHFHALSDPPSFWQGLGILAAATICTVTYGTLGFYFLDRHFHIHYDFSAALRQTIIMFTQFYDPGLHPITGFGRYFAFSIYVIGAVTLAYALLMLLRPVLVRRAANPSMRRRATRIVEQYGHSSLARFALFPDKFYFFSPGGSVIAYTVKGRVAIALGDPIGPPADTAVAVADFQNYCRRNDWSPAFYQVLPESLDTYRAAGYEALCIGHEGIVALDCFNLSGGANKNLRAIKHRLQRIGYTTRVYSAPLPPTVLAELRAVSDEWLTMMHGSEQRFALGWFDDAYVANSQVMALHDPQGAIVAFANFVPEYQRNELALDLMRRRQQTEAGSMEFLFIAMLEWAQTAGYNTFNLGLSALSGVGEAANDPVLERTLYYIYGHINQFYNFRGLHEFKEKFHPEWSPRYLI